VKPRNGMQNVKEWESFECSTLYDNYEMLPDLKVTFSKQKRYHKTFNGCINTESWIISTHAL
jgi:hypothetical protein